LITQRELATGKLNTKMPFIENRKLLGPFRRKGYSHEGRPVQCGKI